MMKITRDVIEDLLPLYLADEVSADTRALVDEYLRTDPELASMAERSDMAELPQDIPVSLTKEDRMEAYKEAKRLMFLRTVILAAIISSSLIVVFLVSLVAFRAM
jgi:anti-sigma factor RsiW